MRDRKKKKKMHLVQRCCFEGLGNAEGDGTGTRIAGKITTAREITADAFNVSCPPSSVAYTAGSGFPYGFLSFPPNPLSVKENVVKSKTKSRTKRLNDIIVCVPMTEVMG